MQKTLIQSLGRKDPLEMGMAPYSSILAWRIPWIEEPGGYSPWDCKQLDMTEWLTLSLFFFHPSYYTGKRQKIRAFRHCWRWTWTDGKIIGLKASFLSTNQNGSLCGSIEEIWTQFIFMDNLIGTLKPLSGFSPISVYMILYKHRQEKRHRCIE